MIENEDHWCNVCGRVAWQAYAKPKLKTTRLLNVIIHIKMIVDIKYVGMVSDTWYRWRMVDIIKPRLEPRAKKRMSSDNRALSRK